MFVSNPSAFWTLAVAMLVSSSVGCTSLKLAPFSANSVTATNSPVEQATATAPTQQTEPTQSCIVEVRSYQGQLKEGQVAITEGMSVQDVLVAIKVDRVFTRMNIELQRSTKKSHQPLKMPVTYDRRKKEVNPAYNYAIRHGDRLLITEDTSNAFDDMMESALSRIGMPGRR